MVLQKRNEARGRQIAAGLASRLPVSIARGVSLITEPFGQATAQVPLRIGSIIGVISIHLPGCKDVQSVVDVVVPLRSVESRIIVTAAIQIVGRVVIVLKNQMNVPFSPELLTNGFRNFTEDIGARIICNRMHSVQAQAVKVILLQPVKRVVNEIIANRTAPRPVKVDGRTPRRAMTVGKKLRRVKRQVIPFWTEVVINHVQENHQVLRVGSIDEALQIVRPAISSCWSVRQHAVVTPIALARKT